MPITFVEREYGDSKMSGKIVVEAMVLVTKWGMADTLEQPPRQEGLAPGQPARRK